MVKIVKAKDKSFKKMRGYYKKILFDAEELKSPGNRVQDMKYEPLGKVASHYHKQQTEVFYTISGKAEWNIDGQFFITESGDCIVIEPGEVHAIKNPLNKEWHFIAFKINYPKDDPKGDSYWLEDEK